MQQRQLATSTTHLAQELLMNVQCSGESRSFSKEIRALKMRSAVASHWSRQWPIERIIAANPLTTTREIAEEHNVDHSSVVWLLKQIGKLKKLNKWVPHELHPPKTIVVLKCCLLLFYTTTMNHFSIELLYTGKSGFYQDNLRWSAQLLDREEAPKHIPKPKCTKKRSWSRFGGLLPAWSTIAFWSRQNHYTWEVCSANCWDVPETATPVAGIGQQNGPNSLQQRLTTHPTTNASKVEWIGLRSFASSAIFTWPLANQLTLLQASQQLLAGKMPPQPAGGRKYFPRVLQIPKHRFLRYKNKQTYFLLAKMHWL